MSNKPESTAAGTSASRATIRIGDPAEWEDLARRNAKFVGRMPSLVSATKIAFERSAPTDQPLDKLIFCSGRLRTEDFFEILLLCANGYGFGGIKLLRGMYEKLVTAAYLRTHPEETDTFLNFFGVAGYRLLKVLVDNFGSEGEWAEEWKAAQTQFEKLKGDYQVPHCEHCPKTRANYTWSKMDPVAMANKSGIDALARLAFDSYAIPTQYGHSTVMAILPRRSVTEDGTVFEGGAQREWADRALFRAHYMLLYNAGVASRSLWSSWFERIRRGCQFRLRLYLGAIREPAERGIKSSVRCHQVQTVVGEDRSLFPASMHRLRLP